MAEGKKSFLLYADMLPTVKKLVEKDRINKTNNAGELFLHLLEYVCDNNPEPVNDIVDLMFEPIKTTLKRDLAKWEEKSPERIEKARIAGLASAEARRLKKELNSTTELNNELNSTKSTVSVSVNVSDINNSSNLSVDFEKLKVEFNNLTGKKTKVVSEKAKRQIKARLKEGYTKQDLWNSIVNCFNDPYHKENPKYLTLEFISRSDKMEKYCENLKPKKTKEDKL